MSPWKQQLREDRTCNRSSLLKTFSLYGRQNIHQLQNPKISTAVKSYIREKEVSTIRQRGDASKLCCLSQRLKSEYQVT